MTGPGVLILHGFTSTTASMEPVAQGLEEGGVRRRDAPAARPRDPVGRLGRHQGGGDHRSHRRRPPTIGRTLLHGGPGGPVHGRCPGAAQRSGHHSPAAVVINPGLRLSPGTGMGARLLSRVRPTIGSIAGDIASPKSPKRPKRAPPSVPSAAQRDLQHLPCAGCRGSPSAPDPGSAAALIGGQCGRFGLGHAAQAHCGSAGPGGHSAPQPSRGHPGLRR